MKKQYLMTERAHFMCPNMHFGILMEIEKEYDKEAMKTSLLHLADAHPFLKSLITYENGTDRLYYRVTGESKIDVVVRENKAAVWADYEELSKQNWNVFEKGLLKVYVCPEKDGMTVLFAAHHLLADGRGLLELSQEFARDYVKGIVPAYAEENLMESIDDLPEGSRLSGIGKLLVRQANKQWVKENHKVSYEQYEDFVKQYAEKNRVSYETYEADKEALQRMKELCKANGFSINDLLMAYVYLRKGTKKIVIASDVRNVISNYNKGALGNYATAMGISCNAKTTDVTEMAKKVHKAVQKHMKKNSKLMLVVACYFEMSPTLLDAAVISTIGEFESKAGHFVGEGMLGYGQPDSYSITNLGKIENDCIKSVMFIPPASPIAKFTLGVVTLNEEMRLCSSVNKRAL